MAILLQKKNSFQTCSGILLAFLLFINLHMGTAQSGNTENTPLGKLEAKVGPYKGRNVFFINGEPHAPFMYSSTEQGRKTWADPTKRCIEEFTAQGYDIIQTDMWFKYSLMPDGTFDMDGIRSQLAGILRINPNAKLVVRINVSAPKWWCDQYPEELCKVTNQEANRNIFAGNTAESLASEKYQEFARFYLKKFYEELEKTPEADRIIAFHIGGGVYGEWHYYGIYDEPDASGPMRKRFQSFAINKYRTLDKVNATWKTNFPGIEDIVVPSYDRRYLITDGDFRDPQEDMYVIDYYECQQKTVSQLVNGLAKITKETWSRPVITGIFYGYFYGNWTVGSQSSQADIETIFNSPYLDYFSGPYGSRNLYGSGHFRSMAESVALHGKIWISEHDGGTYLGASGNGQAKFPDIPLNEHQSIAQMRRNYMYCFTENAGQWWYDFGPFSQGGGWWSTPAMLTEAKDLLDLSNKFMEAPFEKNADVLVVYDMNSFSYVRPAMIDKLTFKITQDMTDALIAAGISSDRIFLMDLKLVELSKYKLVIFGNTFALDDDQRDYIKNEIIKDGRSVVFISGSGYTDGYINDPALVSGLTGINIEKAEETDPEMKIMIDEKEITIKSEGVSSIFKVADHESQSLGIYNNGDIAAAVKNVNGCKVYYFGIPPGRDLPVYNFILEESGIRKYVENTLKDDYVAAGGGIIGIYSVQGGEKTIRPLSGKEFSIDLKPYSCVYFNINTGEILTRDVEASVSNPGSFKVYPNPASTYLNIERESFPVNARIEITGIDSKKSGIYYLDFSQNAIDVSGLAQGMYVLRVITPYNVDTSRFIKVN